MTTISSDMIDAIFTKTSADIGANTTVEVVPASSDRRPFLSFVRLDPAAGSMDCQIVRPSATNLVVAVNGDLYSGLVVGNKGDSIEINSVGATTARYAFTGGYLRISQGNIKTEVKNS